MTKTDNKPTYVLVYRCVHCRGITLLLPDDARNECGCGHEFHPERGSVPLRQPYNLARFTGTVLEADIAPEARGRFRGRTRGDS